MHGGTRVCRLSKGTLGGHNHPARREWARGGRQDGGGSATPPALGPGPRPAAQPKVPALQARLPEQRVASLHDATRWRAEDTQQRPKMLWGNRVGPDALG